MEQNRQAQKQTFCLEEYAHLLNNVLANGYRAMNLGDYQAERPSGRVVIFRHDVDVTPSEAMALAECELTHGIRSTYFIRIRAEYNVLQAGNQSILKWLLQNGFEIGLHYDADQRASSRQEFISDVIMQKRLLETALGQAVSGVCPHMPKHQPYLLTPEEARSCGFAYEAGEPTFNMRTRFTSDSNGRWKDGLAPMKLIGTEEQIYLLTHPVWWVTDRHPHEIVAGLQARR